MEAIERHAQSREKLSCESCDQRVSALCSSAVALHSSPIAAGKWSSSRRRSSGIGGDSITMLLGGVGLASLRDRPSSRIMDSIWCKIQKLFAVIEKLRTWIGEKEGEGLETDQSHGAVGP